MITDKEKKESLNYWISKMKRSLKDRSSLDADRIKLINKLERKK